MTQFQFEVICSIIEKGAPALAIDLCTALNNLVNERNSLVTELDKLKTSEVTNSKRKRRN